MCWRVMRSGMWMATCPQYRLCKCQRCLHHLASVCFPKSLRLHFFCLYASKGSAILHHTSVSSGPLTWLVEQCSKGANILYTGTGTFYFVYHSTRLCSPHKRPPPSSYCYYSGVTDVISRCCKWYLSGIDFFFFTWNMKAHQLEMEEKRRDTIFFFLPDP